MHLFGKAFGARGEPHVLRRSLKSSPEFQLISYDFD